MKFSYILGVVVALFIIVAAWYYTSQPEVRAETVTVGVIGPFTGPLAQYGEAYRNGVLMAMQDFETEKYNIEFIFEDSEYDTAKAVGAYQKLVNVDKVDLVMDWGAATGYGIAPLVDGAGVPLIAFSVDPDVVKSSQYIVRQFYSPDDWAEVMWGHFRANNQKNIAIVKLKLLYYDRLTESLKKLAKEGESVTVVDEYQFGDTDFRTSLAKIKTSGAQPDALGVFLAGGQIAQFYKQADQQGVATPTFGADFFESYSEIADAGGLMDGAVYANIGVSDVFVEKYKTKFGNENQVSFAGQSYDFVKILRDTVDFTDRDSIINSLRGIQNVNGILGAYTYSGEGEDQYLKSQVYIKKIQGDTIQTVR